MHPWRATRYPLRRTPCCQSSAGHSTARFRSAISSITTSRSFARSQGLDPFAVGLIWTIGSGGKFFLYRSTVLIVGHSYGYFGRRDLLRMGIWVTIVEAGVVLLLAAVYWPWLGIGFW